MKTQNGWGWANKSLLYCINPIFFSIISRTFKLQSKIIIIKKKNLPLLNEAFCAPRRSLLALRYRAAFSVFVSLHHAVLLRILQSVNQGIFGVDVHHNQLATCKKRSRGNRPHTCHVDNLSVVVAAFRCHVAAPEHVIQQVWIKILTGYGAEVFYISCGDNRCRVVDLIAHQREHFRHSFSIRATPWPLTCFSKASSYISIFLILAGGASCLQIFKLKKYCKVTFFCLFSLLLSIPIF